MLWTVLYKASLMFGCWLLVSVSYIFARQMMRGRSRYYVFVAVLVVVGALFFFVGRIFLDLGVADFYAFLVVVLLSALAGAFGLLDGFRT